MTVAVGASALPGRLQYRHFWQRIDWYDLGALLLLVLLPALFWWRLITPVAADASILRMGDLTEQYFPLRIAVAAQLRAGQIPFWNPWINGGQPLLADPQAGVLYPPNLLLLLLGRTSFRDFEYEIIAHYAIAASGTYLLVRSLLGGIRAARWAGLVAALTFSYGGFLTAYPALQPSILRSAVWLPWTLYGLSAGAGIVARSQSLLRALPAYVLSGVALALAILGGHPQTVFYILLAAGFYTVWLALRQIGLGRRVWFKPLLGGIVCLLFGCGLSAAALLPAIEFAGVSARNKSSYAFATSYGLPLDELLALVVPSVGGGGTLYNGIVPLLLAGAGIVFAWSTRSGWRANSSLPWLLLGLAGLLLAFAGSTFAGSIAYLFLPGFGLFRNHERIVLLFSLSVAVLAGQGAAVLGGSLNRFQRQLLRGVVNVLGWAVVVALVLLAVMELFAARPQPDGSQLPVLLVHWLFLLPPLLIGVGLIAMRARGLRPRLFWWLAILGLIIFDLFSLNAQSDIQDGYVTGSPYPPSPVAAYLQAEQASEPPFRISSEGLLPADGSAGAVYGLEDLISSNPLAYARWDSFNQTIEGGRKLELMDVGYIVSKRDLTDSRYEQVRREGDLHVYRVKQRLGHAWLASAVEVIADEGALLQRLGAQDFEPGRTALLAQPIGGIDASRVVTGTLVGLRESPGMLALRAEAAGPALLVASEIYDPGWRALIDGKPVQVVRADYTLLAVPLPAGSHSVTLSYEPQYWKAGVTISLVSLAGLLLVLVGAAWRLQPRQRLGSPPART